MHMTTQNIGRFIVVALAGRLDAVNSSAVEQHLLHLLCHANKPMVLDFRFVEYVSSVGLHLLLTLQKQAESLSLPLFLISIPSQVCHVLKISGLHNLLKIYDNLESIPSF